MAYSAKVLTDSLSPDGVRLTTMEVTFPRIVLAEFNTHRMFSRNSASSRAIPVEKMLKKVEDDPFIPIWWGKNQPGMQANEELSEEHDGYVAISDKPDPGYQQTSPRLRAQWEWLSARDSALKHAKELQRLGLHKQISNRLLEPWLWHTVIVTATEWSNFFALRCHPDAQPEIRRVAEMMWDVREASISKQLSYNQWHLPLVNDDESWTNSFTINDICKVSVGRCARVSYLTHDGIRDPQADIDLANKLQTSGHMSPFEHVARSMTCDDAKNIVMNQMKTCGTTPPSVEPKTVFCGNFKGWISVRKMLPNEADFSMSM